MPKLVIGMSLDKLLSRGFTLVEILVVLFIISITTTIVLYAFGDFGKSRRLNLAAEHFVHYLKLAQEQAILEVGTLGIYADNEGYYTARYQPNSGWKPITRTAIFTKKKFPQGTIIQFDKTSTIKNPPIIVNASGDINAFSMIMSMTNDESSVIVKTDDRGKLIINSMKKP